MSKLRKYNPSLPSEFLKSHFDYCPEGVELQKVVFSSGDGGFTVITKGKTSCWKHTIKTEEVSEEEILRLYKLNPSDENYIVADPQPNFGFGFDKIVKVPDMFHADAFKGTPAEGYGETGPRQDKWYVEDWCGNLIAEYDLPVPEGAIEGRFKDGVFVWDISDKSSVD